MLPSRPTDPTPTGALVQIGREAFRVSFIANSHAEEERRHEYPEIALLVGARNQQLALLASEVAPCNPSHLLHGAEDPIALSSVSVASHWRHRTTGNLYRTFAVARGGGSLQGKTIVFYCGDAGVVWARDLISWHGGMRKCGIV